VRLWVGQGFDEEPLPVRVPRDLVPLVTGLARGQEVSCTVEPYGRGNRIEYTLRALALVESGRGRDAAAS
jgi:hypothetical protein